MATELKSSHELDMNQIIAEANRSLPYDLQVRPDDPVLSLVALNNAMMKAYTQGIQKALEEAQHQIGAASIQEVENCKTLAGKMIDRTGEHLKEQLQEVGLAWEAKFKASASEELAKVKNAALAATIGGYALLAGGIIFFCMMLGKLATFLIQF